ncbi:TetR/AcrR family transcriptional regulator [Nocardia farcinica]|uniref:TetR/AcrR family transcriptional regulator n=1 Tax=Nocardia farcinica TaxID=37329 RepID=UPI000A35EFAB|nr:TetR/AcrR family transcriptional regulator [Nocardia farcinica]MBF6070823.1 TetR/AcrR family transcriptional regulator [Nocardia farcinica]MBF6139921.1 TetR/AcrR family transcriptional regulator [Nocardia farcinica]MBF6249448.1 TetR/AcrR family transcriptional regulator [Nocardia farcinica]MBF6371495.1 TetR/AcrR family transcriptional regulator [Nocardia farcinica]MBF6575519.1 TetR/AcrR family transcriptional regulator [Nocardia farcinica]
MTRVSSESARPPGRPRSGLHAVVFAATLQTVHELGYARATVDRIAAAAGVAKTTVYRRWPSKGALIIDCLLDAFGPVPLEGADRAEIMTGAIRWIAGKIAEPGVGDAFAGVFSDAVSDPELRTLLSTRFQDPYRIAVQDALGESEQRVLFYIDVVVGTLLHRMGMTGAPMVESDVEALIEMTLRYFGTGDEGSGR